MSFLGGAECSTAANPLSQFTKHVQGDRTLQNDRLLSRGPGGLEESMRSRIAPNGSDQMMNDFLQQQPAAMPSPFAMEQLRRDLPTFQAPVQRTPSPGWSADFDPSEQARMEAAFATSKMAAQTNAAFSPAEFGNFQPAAQLDAQRGASPINHTAHLMNGYSRPMGVGYLSGMGGMNYGMNMPGYNSFNVHQEPQNTADVKGKSRMVELDDSNWEEQFQALDQDQDNQSEAANLAMEAELEQIDRQMNAEQSEYDNPLTEDEISAWESFDSTMGLNTHASWPDQVAPLGPYQFESQNPFLENANQHPSPFEQGVQILREHGNLSLAALAFEAAVQQNPDHLEAWTLLGSAQAQNEKESPAIRALEHALQLDPNNLDALMGLAVSYTNEGYDTTAYRTLERWLSVKYPNILSPDDITAINDVGFTNRELLHERVTDLFIRAAQLSPTGESMDPDVQVGLGVLFYGNEEYEKAVDCFQAALASTETGIVNREGQIHLLWNRLGATLANSGQSEDAIAAYQRALEVNPNFVRARYNLGVSCINIGCYPEAAAHLLGALDLHRVVAEQGRDRARAIVPDEQLIPDADLDRLIQQNESSNLYDTLRRAFGGMGRRDLSEKVGVGMQLDQFRGEFDF